MKMQIQVDIEVDPAEWAEAYACEVAEVRDDVWSYFANHIGQAGAAQGGVPRTDVTVQLVKVVR